MQLRRRWNHGPCLIIADTDKGRKKEREVVNKMEWERKRELKGNICFFLGCVCVCGGLVVVAGKDSCDEGDWKVIGKVVCEL